MTSETSQIYRFVSRTFTPPFKLLIAITLKERKYDQITII
jgi:hypothetical protein